MQDFRRAADAANDASSEAEPLPVPGKSTRVEAELPGPGWAGPPGRRGADHAPLARSVSAAFAQPKLKDGATGPGAKAALPVPTGGGAKLPEAARARLEGVLGASFASVAIHEDPRVAQLGARAMTIGEHVLFAPGEYEPATSKGLELIAHELVHVDQQRAGRAAGEGLVADPGLEGEADAGAAKLGSGASAHVPAATHAAPTSGVAQPKLVGERGNGVRGRPALHAIVTEDAAPHRMTTFLVVEHRGSVDVVLQVLGGVDRYVYNWRAGTYRADGSDSSSDSDEDEGPRRGRQKHRGNTREATREKTRGKLKRNPSTRGGPSPDHKKQRLVGEEDEIDAPSPDDERPMMMDESPDSPPSSPSPPPRRKVARRKRVEAPREKRPEYPKAAVKRHAPMEPSKEKRVVWPDPGYESPAESEDSDYAWEEGERGERVDMIDRAEQYAPMRARQNEVVGRTQMPMTPDIRLRRELAVYERYLLDRIRYLDVIDQPGNAEELERLRDEQERIVATRAHHEALDDVDASKVNVALRKGEELENPPNIVVPQGRGIQYARSAFTAPERRAHRSRLEVGESVFSTAAYQLLNRELVKDEQAPLVPGDPRADVGNELHERAVMIARRVRERVIALKDEHDAAEELDRGKTSLAAQSGIGFDNLYDVHQTKYSNAYSDYHGASVAKSNDEEIADPLLKATFDALFRSAEDPKWTANPMLSWGDENGHPQRYALGDKPPNGNDPSNGESYKDARLRPLYNHAQDGTAHPKRPYSGMTEAALFPATEMFGREAPSHVMSMNGEMRTDVGYRISAEHESSFAGIVEEDRVIFQQLSKFPSFEGDYDPAALLKYGITPQAWEEFQGRLSKAGPPGSNDDGKKAKKKLTGSLAKHYEGMADEEVQLQAARMGAMVRHRDIYGGLSRDMQSNAQTNDFRNDVAKESQAEDQTLDGARDATREAYAPRKELGRPEPTKDVMADDELDEFLDHPRAEMAANSGAFYPFRDYRMPDAGGEKAPPRAPAVGDPRVAAMAEFGREMRKAGRDAFDAAPELKEKRELHGELYQAFCATFNRVISTEMRAMQEQLDPHAQLADVEHGLTMIRATVEDRIPDSIQRALRAENALDLNGFGIQKIGGNGNCLFEAVNATLNRGNAVTLRASAVAEIRAHPDAYNWTVPGRTAEQIAAYLEAPRRWSRAEGDVAPLALANAELLTIVVHSRLFDFPLRVGNGALEIHVLYNGYHYDALIRNG